MWEFVTERAQVSCTRDLYLACRTPDMLPERRGLAVMRGAGYSIPGMPDSPGSPSPSREVSRACVYV